MLRSSVFSKVFIVLKFRAHFAPPLRLVLDGRRQAIAKASGIWRSSKLFCISKQIYSCTRRIHRKKHREGLISTKNITIIVLCIPSADFGFEK